MKHLVWLAATIAALAVSGCGGGSSSTDSSVPSPPAGVNVAAGDAQIQIGWEVVPDATSYNIYYSTSAGVSAAAGTRVPGAKSGDVITGLKNGTTYHFVVTAVGSGGESPVSSEVSATPQVPAPNAPVGVVVTAGDGQASISWDAVAGAASYNVYYHTLAGVTPSNGTMVTGVLSGSAITGLVNGTAYYFVVTAVNAGGESMISAEASATPQVPAPNAPAGVGVTVGNGQVSITWAALTGATSYNVYYGTSAGVTISNGTMVPGVSSGSAITGLANGTTYYFVVTAVNAGGESPISGEVNATPQVPAPGAPTGVGVTAGNAQVTVSWDAVAGATSYNFYYRTSTGVTTANGMKIAGVSSGTTITSLVNGTTYYFVVTAVSAGGESAVSSEVNATPQIPVPGAPVGVGVTAGNAQVTVSWDAVAGATSYNFYYRTSTGVTTANGMKIAGVTSGSTITGLVNGTIYYFVVTAVNAGGEGAISSEVNATPQAPAPGAPMGVGAVAGDGRATISWTAVTGATSYNVYHHTAGGVTAANGTRVAGATSGSAITGLANGTKYYFVVTAVNAGGESPISSEVSAVPFSPGVWTTKTPMANQRDNAANAVLNGTIYVMGGAPAGVSILDSMEAYDPVTDTWTTKAAMPPWSTFPTVPPWAPTGTAPALPGYRYGPAAAPANGSIYLIGGTSLVNGQGPIYPIAAYDPDTNNWSSTVRTTAATILAGTAGQPLAPFPTGRWGFDVAVVDGLIYAIGGAVHVPGGINISEPTATKITGATSTSPAVDPAGTTITGLNNWEQYYFIVTAVDAFGNESAPSPEVSALLRAQWAAGAGTSAGDGEADISWMEATGAVSYNVYFSNKPGVTPSSPTKVTGIVPTPTVVSTTVTGLANGTPYYFIVTAVDAGGNETAASGEFAVTPQAVPPASVPSSVAVTSGNAQATLTWTPVAGAASYNIYYGTGANIYYGAVEAYDPVANTWTTKATMPTPRWGSTVSVVNGHIYAIGGWGGWPELSVVEVYDPVSDSWSTTVPVSAATMAAGTAGMPLAPMPTARDDFGFAVVNGFIYAIGGDTNTFNDVARTPCCTNIVEAYDPVANTWSMKTPMPTIRDDFDASTADGVIYAIAGSRDGQFTQTGTLTQEWLAANNGGFSLTTVEAFSTSDIPVPRGVTATASGTQSFLSWNAVTGATSYNIYWSNRAGVSTGANSTKISNVTSPYIHTGLASGAWYYYVVTAVTDLGESLPSGEVAVKP